MKGINIKKNNVGFLKALGNFLNNFGFMTASVLVMAFFIFNVGEWSENFIQQSDILNSIFKFCFFALCLFCICLLDDKTKKDLRTVWTDNKDLKGIMPFATYFGGFIVLSFVFSCIKVATRKDVITGILSNKVLLIIFYYIVSFFETLIFCILLYVLFKRWTNEDFWSAIYTCLIFSLFHGYRYNWNIPSMIFAFFANLLFLYLTWSKKFAGLPTIPIVLAGHQCLDIAGVDGFSVLF